MRIVKIFDCYSSLFPQIDEELIKKLSSKTEMDARVYDMPTSVILVNGKCGNYFKIITSLENENCNEAIKRIVSKIDLDQINAKIDELKEASDLQKSFLKKY